MEKSRWSPSCGCRHSSFSMEIKVIKKILYSPRIKQKELAEDVGASVSTVQRIIKKLVKEEKIVRMNGKRNGYWKVL